MKMLDKNLLLSQIREKGVQITSINELMRMNSHDKDLIPVLLYHLENLEDEQDKEFLARCLGVKGYTEVTEILIKEFYSATRDSYKWAIGNSLSLINDKRYLQEYLNIVQEKEHGIGRQMIVLLLAKYKTDEVKKVLHEIINHEGISGQVIISLRKVGDRSSIDLIRPFLNSKNSWHRKEAKKTIEKLESKEL